MLTGKVKNRIHKGTFWLLAAFFILLQPAILSAAVIISDPVSISIPTSSSERVYLNLVTGESGTSPVSGGDVWMNGRVSLTMGGSAGANFVGDRNTGTTWNLPDDYVVNSESPRIKSGDAARDGDYAVVLDSAHNVFGIRFWNEGTYHYGWIRVSLAASVGVQPRAIVEYAYESEPDTPITVVNPGHGGGGGGGCASHPACGLASEVNSTNVPPADATCVELVASASCSSGMVFDSDLDFRDAFFGLWQSAHWVSTGGPQVAASLYGRDLTGGSEVPVPRDLVVQDMVLTRVALEMNEIRNILVSDGGGSGVLLSLEDAAVTYNLEQPQFGNISTDFTLRVPGGTGRIVNLEGLQATPMTLEIASGAALVFQESGDLAPGVPDADRCYFTEAVTGLIDGGTLNLEDSHVIFGSTPADGLTIQNGGHIQLTGSGSTLDLTDLVLDGSSMELGNNTSFKHRNAGGTLTLLNSHVTLFDGSRLTSPLIEIDGDSSLSVFNVSPGDGVNGNVVLNQDAQLTIDGTGFATFTALLVNFGSTDRIHVKDSATLRLDDAVGELNSSGIMQVDKDALVVMSAFTVIVRDAYTMIINGALSVTGQLVAEGTIEGSGGIEIGSGGGLAVIGDAGRLTVNGELYLVPFSTTSLILNPLTAESQHIRVRERLDVSPGASRLAKLDLAIDEDAELPVGTKLLLIDYRGAEHVINEFEGKPEGAIFQLGLNKYQIRYTDPDYDAADPRVITLTVIAPDTVHANDDSYAAVQDSPLVVPAPGVLANDVNVSGAATLVAPPMHGDVVLQPDGSFIYLSSPGFNGDDLFTYLVGSGASQSNIATVRIHVRAQENCTLTAGYWKNHTGTGGSALDSTWLELPIGTGTPFFKSGQTYLEVLAAETKGNAYYTLAQQYIAAELNFLHGAAPSDVQQEFDEATALFDELTPDEVAALEGSDRETLIMLATILDEYNNGLIGPGSCHSD